MTKTTSAVATVDGSTASTTKTAAERGPSGRRKKWGGRTFRFSPSSFRLGSNFSLRRFSITEGALLFAMAYIASSMLGVIRQVIFNALFGTGPEATAYYSAFRLPDTLFNLIASGALTYAFIPIFIKPRRKTPAFMQGDIRRVPCLGLGHWGKPWPVDM